MNLDRTPNNSLSTPVENLCWKSIFTGTITALLAYSALLAVGLAIGGANLQGAIQGPDTFKGLGIGTIAWLILAVAISLFFGGFVARISRRYVSERIGRLQALVIAGIFFLIMLAQIGSGIAAFGKAVGAAGEAGAMSAQDSHVQNVIEDSLGAGNLKSRPEVVAQGIASRLISGDTESATNYYAAQAGISHDEAVKRVDAINQRATAIATDAGIAAAKAMKFAGWFLFALMLAGTAAAIGGGSISEDHLEMEHHEVLFGKPSTTHP